MRLDRRSAWEKYLEESPSLPFDATATPDTVPNGSFEEGDGTTPTGWTLARGELGGSTEWCAAGGFDGGRCLRLSSLGEGASWHSTAITVSGGAEYVFQCRMKRAGHIGWASACEVTWVSLVFLDSDGQPLRKAPDDDQPLVPVRADITDGWTDAWRHLTAPREATALRIGFRLDPVSPQNNDAAGDWWIDDVRIERMPLAVEPAQGILCLHVKGGHARVRIAGTHRECCTPKDAYAYRAGDGSFHPARENSRLSLPPGSYTVEASRGFQREPFSKAVEIVEGHETSLTVELPRIADWPAQNWYAGDHHTHLASRDGSRYPLMTIDDVCAIARGEGLDFLSFCADDSDRQAYAEWRAAGGPRDARPDGVIENHDFLSALSFEAGNDTLGHLCLINPPAYFQPGHRDGLLPTGADVSLAVRRATRGALVMAHPFAGLSGADLPVRLADPAQTRIYRELPVDAVLGFGDVFELMHGQGDIEAHLDTYFRLLNLGLRLGVAGSTGVYSDRGEDLPGTIVTFVHAERFSMDSLAGGYQSQRTMASNGPLLRLRANGKNVGATVTGAKMHLEAEAFSNWGLARVEILFGGHVIADATPDEEGWARIDTEWTADRSGWLLGRAWGPGQPAINMGFVPADRQAEQGQWAVSSPIYVEVPGRPTTPNPNDAEYFIRWIDASMEAIRKRKDYAPDAPITDADVAAALGLFERGRVFFEDLRQRL